MVVAGWQYREMHAAFVFEYKLHSVLKCHKKCEYCPLLDPPVTLSLVVAWCMGLDVRDPSSNGGLCPLISAVASGYHHPAPISHTKSERTHAYNDIQGNLF